METQKWERLGLKMKPRYSLLLRLPIIHHTSLIITRLVFVPHSSINCVLHGLLASCFKKRQRRASMRCSLHWREMKSPLSTARFSRRQTRKNSSANTPFRRDNLFERNRESRYVVK